MLKFGGLSPFLDSFSQFYAKELGRSNDMESNGVDFSTPIC